MTTPNMEPFMNPCQTGRVSRRSRYVLRAPDVPLNLPAGVAEEDISWPCLHGLKRAAAGPPHDNPEAVAREHAHCTGRIARIDPETGAETPLRCACPTCRHARAHVVVGAHRTPSVVRAVRWDSVSFTTMKPKQEQEPGRELQDSARH